MNVRDRIIVALDVKTGTEAAALVAILNPYELAFKVGLEFITSTTVQLLTSPHAGLAARDLSLLRKLFADIGSRLMWDGKFSDIPNTVGGATNGLRGLSPKFFTIHASAGREAITASVANKGTSQVLGVTVLTSIKHTECLSIFGADPESKVLEFALTLVEEGADGIVCSPKELPILAHDSRLQGLVKVIPGIRPAWASPGDQNRIMTPADAIRAGADYLVIGRPITQPPAGIGGSAAAALRIIEELEAVA